MTCDRYWREGIVLVERGLEDPHRDGCAECMRAHASRQELVEALPLIGASSTGDPRWQANVWRRIDGQRADPLWRWRWQLAGALTVACLVALWIGLARSRTGDAVPRVEVLAGAVAMRSRSAHVDDRLRVTVSETSDVWIYRAGRPMLRCHARQVSDGCTPEAEGMIVELVLSTPGKYQVIVFEASVVSPRGGLDEDTASLEAAGTDYREYGVMVR